MNSRLKVIIDLGSLKAKLTAFDVQTFDVVFQKSYLTLLGKNMSEDKLITEDAFTKLDTALINIKDELRNLDCADIKFIATESLRMAKNKDLVFDLVKKYFPFQIVTIINQESEGEMFFRAVSRCFPNQKIIAMDVGGGSVQILHGTFHDNLNRHTIDNKYLYKTGTYRLQQKYSPDYSIINYEFDKVFKAIRKEFCSLDATNDTLVFGSTCMQDFLKEAGVVLQNDRPVKKHPDYTTVADLKHLLADILQHAPANRGNFYPSDEYFSYGADYLLANVIEAAEKLKTKYIYPTNINSSYDFIK